MVQRRALAPLAASLLAWPALARAQATLAQPAALSAFFQNALFESAKLSPDGTRVAFLVAAPGEHSRLGVVDLQTMKSNVAVGIQGADVGEFDWVNEQRLLFTQDGDKWRGGLYAVNHDGSLYKKLKSFWGGTSTPHGERGLLPADAQLIHINSRRKTDYVYVVTPRQNNKQQGVRLFVLSRVNTVTRFVEVLDSPLYAQEWFMDRDDVLRAVVSHRDGQGSFDVLQPDGRFKSMYTFNAHDAARSDPRPAYWAPDGSVYAVAPALGDMDGIYAYDLNKAQLAAQPLLASKDFSLWPRFVANDEHVLGLRYTVDAEVTLWLDPQLKAHQATIDQLLPDTTNRVSQAQRPTQPYLLVQATSDTQPELGFLFNTQTGKLTRLGAARPEIKPARMGLMDLVRIKARDGLEIPVWLTLPQGSGKADKKHLPLVVMVRGPWDARHQWQWQSDVQFLASRGYAVIQPEVRGVTGYGTRHFKAGWKQWGLSMQSDLADAARWAVAQGIADPRRVAIMGGGRVGFGGYAAMMGLVTDPGLYRCAINYLGVADLGLLYSVDWDYVTDDGKRFSYGTQVGDPVADAAQFKATSPLQLAARITQPVLLAYRSEDAFVPKVHGEKLRDALKAHNPGVEWVEYEEETGRGWGGAPTRLDFWDRVERFLAKNLAVTP